ncbi:hypothetical protein [Virgibacillus pantothenticus]|uniref:Uncharacterized protein n=1 Tax=Virgibacillus pantothenticus TaxID=1473 RepID=A0A0L0QV48_VIRPA|nr:hypothetical protein [Virgibacillus pantothenticus]KNE22459.1 hypothetical protein AFK71_02230 [Virgibacillus pantothenticus]MED3738814.1 hypothetical protein [Virgibacillus pantothenticus]QTY16923.1 hypothetical protein KBP50_03095 [Virgibacillus pantothenticus]SIT18247.1 hypothetical protein SAMN05421787_1414 [Virgibacillus pantothenticus]
MEIKVNEQPQRFYLAWEDKWVEAVGHEIKVGNYSFCAIPMPTGVINVSEITTGLKFYELPMNAYVLSKTDTKEKTFEFLEKVGESIRRLIGNTNVFDKQIIQGRKNTEKLLGKKPETENVDIEELIK